VGTELFDLTGKNAFVAGSGQGLGLEIATGLGLAGAAVILNDIVEDRLTASMKPSIARKSLAAAREHLETAEKMVNDMGYHCRDPEVLLESARLKCLEGNMEKALGLLERAEERIDEMGCYCWRKDAEVPQANTDESPGITGRGRT
jgi:NAD(P)-dependent dehydrogenase (short-subunit alcohol dehydrogenase family)